MNLKHIPETAANEGCINVIHGPPRWECPVHGEVTNTTMEITIPGESVTTLCVRCFRDKLVDLGVASVTAK